MNLSLLPDKIVEISNSFLEHNRFEEAALLHIEAFLANFRKNVFLSYITNSEATQVILAYIMYYEWRHVDFGEEGATLSKLQQVAMDQQLGGARRIATLVNVLRVGGLLTASASDTDARARILRPTDRAKQIFQEVMVAFQKPIALLRDDSSWVNQLSRSGAAGHSAALAVSGNAAHHYFINSPPPIAALDELDELPNKDNALKFLLQLYAQRDARDIVVANVSSLGRDFGVSRQQVHRTLRAAEDAGLFKTLSTTRRELQLNPVLITALRTYIALYLAIMSEGARITFEAPVTQ